MARMLTADAKKHHHYCCPGHTAKGFDRQNARSRERDVWRKDARDVLGTNLPELPEGERTGLR